jgi:drug/metabolite transporter (DMT)-like permease
MADDQLDEHGGDTGNSGQRNWDWGSGAALGIGVGIVFGVVFISTLGGSGIAIGLAIGAGLVPAFAMAMARPAGSNQGPADPNQDPRERD